jgi:hypothetical protein
MFVSYKYVFWSIKSSVIKITTVLIFRQGVLIKTINNQSGDSQNILQKFVRFFLTLSLEILILLRLKVVFEADIIKR